jgi:hypothetical protein
VIGDRVKPVTSHQSPITIMNCELCKKPIAQCACAATEPGRDAAPRPAAAIEILFPDSDLKLSTGEVIRVRELSWHEALEFLKKLSGHFGQFGAGDITALLANLPALITSVDELALHLVDKAAGLTAERFTTLAARDALAVLDKAVEINLNEDLIQRGKKLAARFGGLAAEKTASPKSTTS